MNRGKNFPSLLEITFSASGARAAALRGQVVVIIDVIDMSTTAEGCLEAGALTVLGASPDRTNVVPTDPVAIGRYAASVADEHQAEVLVVAEPRVADGDERRGRIKKLLAGLDESGGRLRDIIPNLGAETPKLCDMKDQVVVIASNAGGVAFDAAFTVKPTAVTTATVARTLKKKAMEATRVGAERALSLARKHRTGITLVAASANAVEDFLGAQEICRQLLAADFLRMPPERMP